MSMRTTPAAATVLAAAALLALTACGSSHTTSEPPAPTAPVASVPAAPGAPADANNTEAKRSALLLGLASVDPGIATNHERAIRRAQVQCATLNTGGSDPDHLAAERFGDPAHPLTDAQGKQIDDLLRATVCPGA